MKETKKRRRRAGKAGYAALLAVCVVVALAAGLALGMMLGGARTSADMEPTAAPAATAVPTAAPTEEPTTAPAATAVPTATSTGAPTEEPTAVPAATPEPTAAPADSPTQKPTDAPTVQPTTEPAGEPTAVPDENAVPANPTGQTAGEGQVVEASIEDRRPLVHADRIRETLARDGLPLAGIRIGIDPGHQGKGNNDKEPVAPGSSEMKLKVSSGTQGVKTRVPEYVVNLDVSFLLRDALEALGAEVYLTRDTHEIDISNIERAQLMNDLGVDLVLRIHCNGSENQSVRGISLFVKSTGEGAEESYLASEALLPAMVESTGARSIGIFERDTYSGLNWSEVPSILVEMGFMSNPEEDVLLNDPVYQEKLVAGMVQGVADYMGRELEAAGE